MTIERNQLKLNIKYEELKKIIKKHGGVFSFERFGQISELLVLVNDTFSLSDLQGDESSVFFFSDKSQMLFINPFVIDSYQQIDMQIDFFKSLVKFATSEFKVSFLNRDSFKLVFCVYNDKKLNFEASTREDWEDPCFFEDYPYFVELANERGLKKIMNEDDEELYDSEDVYNIIYNFRENLLSSDDTYLKIAPSWYITA